MAEPVSGTVRLTVVCVDGDAEERTVPLPVTIGRDPDQADVTIADRMVSRQHVRLEGDGDTVIAVDLGSGNGTWVGDEEVERRAVRPGDLLTVGSAAVVWSPVTGDPDLGTAWCVVAGATGLRALALVDLHAVWVRAAELVSSLSGSDRRTVVDGVDALLDEQIATVAVATAAACSPSADPRGFASAVARLRALPAHVRARALPDTADTRAEDRRSLARLAAVLRAGAAVFVAHGTATPTDGATDLLTVIRSVLVVVVEWDQHLAKLAPTPV